MFILMYVSAIVLANLSVATFGPWVSPINSFLFIGFDLALRDKIHDKWSEQGLFWVKMIGLIAFAGLISFALNPAAGKIAIASVVAFCLAGVADAVVYHLARRKQFMIRSNSSNVAGAAVDSVVFPSMAFGSFLPEIVALQFSAKVLGGAVWSFVISYFKKV